MIFILFSNLVNNFSSSPCLSNISDFATDCSNAEFCASCVCERERERVTSQRRVCVCVCVCGHITVTQSQLVCKHIRASSLCLSCDSVPLSAWTDGKTKDIINCLYIYFESWSSRLWKGELHFRLVLAVFDQSQCTGSVGQSEQTALVERRDFVENEAFERGGA